MPESYLRFEPITNNGVIVSPGIPALWISRKSCIAPTVHGAATWQLKTAKAALQWMPPVDSSEQVIALCVDPTRTFLALGTLQGSLRIYRIPADAGDAGKVESMSSIDFAAHNKGISCISFSNNGLVASGGQEGDIALWDVASESGICRLQGHKGDITDLVVCARSAHLLSASKDALVKVWDRDTQHCLHTLVGHRAEVWSIALDPEECRLVTGSADGLLRVWDVESLWNPDAPERVPVAAASSDLLVADDQDTSTLDPNAAADAWTAAANASEQARRLPYMGAVQRINGRGRVARLRFAPEDPTLLVLQPAGVKQVEFFLCRDEQGTKDHRRRRLAREKKRREKMKRKPKNEWEDKDDDDEEEDEGMAEDESGEEDASVDAQTVASDEISPLCVLYTPHRVSGVDVVGRVDRGDMTNRQRKNHGLQVLVSMRNNVLMSYESTPEDEEVHDKDESGASVLRLREQYIIDMFGHRSDLRHVALSPDEKVVLTGSRDGAKIWNVFNGACLRTLPASSVLSGCFVPGQRHVLVGTKSGSLMLFELASQRCLQAEDGAHNGSIWSVMVQPGSGSRFATAGSDKKVHFWQLELLEGGEGEEQQLSMRLEATMEPGDDILSMRFTADGKMLAVALLDHSVKVYFTDSLKFFVSLYGHRLPVMALDASDDGALLVTGSSDKNVKLWGLDFGDLHKSLFAHSDSVTSVAFQPGTHLFFSGGKDGALKYWDGDRGELILVLDGHAGPIWSLAVGGRTERNAGSPFVVTAGADRTWRVWERTDSPVFVEEERDLRLEATMEAADLKRYQHAAGVVDTRETRGTAQETSDSLKAAERLTDALTLADAELQARNADRAAKRSRDEDVGVDALVTQAGASVSMDHLRSLDDKPSRTGANPLMFGLSPSRYVLRELRRIRRAQLDAALLTLSLDQCIALLRYIQLWLEQEVAVELGTRIAVYIIDMHHAVLSRSMLHAEMLDALATTSQQRLNEYAGEIGFNEAALTFMRTELETHHAVRVFKDDNKKALALREKSKKTQAKVKAVRLALD